MVQILDDLGYKVYSKVLDAKISVFLKLEEEYLWFVFLKPIFKIIIIMYFHHLLN